MIQDVNIILANMPARVTAFTRCNCDMSYTIVINSRLNYESQLNAHHHEMIHIENGDYNKKCSADIIEFYAHLLD